MYVCVSRECPEIPAPHAVGRKRKLEDHEVHDLKKKCQRLELLTARDCVKHCQTEYHKVVSRRTVNTWLKSVGIKSYVSKSKPPVSKNNRRKRLRWAKANKNTDFSNVIVADEVHISTRALHPPRRHLGTVEDRNVTVPEKLSNVVVSIWACFSRAGPGPLCVVSGNMTARRYQAMLYDVFIRYYDGLDEEDSAAYYLHDNASIHTAHSTRLFFEEKGVSLLPIPPYSPDLNPIENTWRQLKEQIALRTGAFPNKVDIETAAKAAWAELPVETCQHLMDSMPNRVRLVIAHRGGMTRY